jgi:hypothetical protein
MSESYVAEFSASQGSREPRDLLARLYREIGLSAVAAALDVMAAPAPNTEVQSERHIPEFLRGEDLAA